MMDSKEKRDISMDDGFKIEDGLSSWMMDSKF